MRDLFLTNYSTIRFIDKIKKSLKTCKSFYFSVSFIKIAGLNLIKNELEGALTRGVVGKIITSTYQNFTDIDSLNLFYSYTIKYKNFETHLDFSCFEDNGFHSKGYLFEFDDHFEFIVGSSNITRYALLKNIEWNVSITDSNKSESYKDAIAEFNNLWNKTFSLSDELIKKYRYVLEYAIEKWDMDIVDTNMDVIKPNSMQRKALKELARSRDLGVKRCLVISATASGKTYLAAMDAKHFDAKRLLFIVHRETILNEALKTFEKVFKESRTYTIFNNKETDLGFDFIFSTNTMLSKHLDKFDKFEFDYIVLDECHHAVASTYQEILSYFNPSFVLGLTATPERMDNQDVFSLFSDNVPFELRLRDAIINDLVVPFHYYAIRDIYADYSYTDKQLISREISKNINVDFIKSEIDKHRPNGKLKCIAFCTSVEHSNRMAYEFNLCGLNAISLTGKNSNSERIKTIEDIQDDTNTLEMICTVDIFNEGVDIPQINTVLFLRPTESATIFIQQLGRGLRKYPNKEYLTVLDFIGNNYDRSTQIALALGSLGNTTYCEKSYLKDLINSDFKALNIQNVEIFFDPLSKSEILRQIDSTNFNLKRFLSSDYYSFKKYLNNGTYPTHMDYLNCDAAPNLIRFIRSKIGDQNKSYYNFLRKIGETDIPSFTDSQVKIIENISLLLPLVRVDEYLIINQLLTESILDLSKLVGFNNKVNLNTLNHAVHILNKKKILINNKLNVDIINRDFTNYMTDLINYGLSRYDLEFNEYDTLFKIGANYYKEQIELIRLKDNLMFMKGTEFDLDTKETLCYVCLNKDKSQDLRLNYKDKFLSSKIFQWESETNTTKDSPTGKKILNTKIVHLFVRKLESEDGITLPFTYFGTGIFKNIRDSYTIEKGIKHNTLLCDIILDNEVDKKYFLDFNIEKDESNETF